MKALLPLSDPLATGWRGMSALMWAALKGHDQAVALLAPVSNQSAVNDRGDTALLLALDEGHERCARLLLPPTDPTRRHHSGKSAFHLAVARGSEELMRLLAPHCQEWGQERDLRGADLFDSLAAAFKTSKESSAWAWFQWGLPLLLSLCPLDPNGPEAQKLPERLHRALGGDSKGVSFDQAQALALSSLEAPALAAHTRPPDPSQERSPPRLRL